MSDILKQMLKEFGLIPMLVSFIFSLVSTVFTYQYMGGVEDKILVTIFLLFLVVWILLIKLVMSFRSKK